jgi:hypothetical protein
MRKGWQSFTIYTTLGGCEEANVQLGYFRQTKLRSFLREILLRQGTSEIGLGDDCSLTAGVDRSPRTGHLFCLHVMPFRVVSIQQGRPAVGERDIICFRSLAKDENYNDSSLFGNYNDSSLFGNSQASSLLARMQSCPYPSHTADSQHTWG